MKNLHEDEKNMLSQFINAYFSMMHLHSNTYPWAKVSENLCCMLIDIVHRSHKSQYWLVLASPLCVCVCILHRLYRNGLQLFSYPHSDSYNTTIFYSTQVHFQNNHTFLSEQTPLLHSTLFHSSISMHSFLILF